MHRAIGLFVLLVVAGLGQAGPAGAVLRSPHLTEDCEQDRSYAEHTFGAWRIEGCTESVEPQEGEVARRKFFGTLELNGMIVEGNSPLIATTTTDGGNRINEIHRESAKLVLDPRILGERRRIVLYSGELDLEVGGSSQFGIGPEPAPGARPAATEGATSYVDLPVSGVPALLGLRIRDQIEDAKVFAGGGVGDDPGYMEFKPPASLGATASALLRDWEGDITVKTVDGQGMRVEDLRFRIPGIELPPLGGFEDLRITYDKDDDEWHGSIFLDLGEPLFTLDLEMDVSSSNGAPTRIEGAVDGLNIPIGNTGIFLQRVNALFDTNPLVMGIGAAATAGPEIAGVALIEMSGDLLVRLELNGESNFRLEVDGHTRVLPVGAGTQLATGDMHIIIDSEGFISIGGNARYELSFNFLGDPYGAAADIGGSGAYATDRDQFNIEAHATGELLMGPFGDFDIVRFEAVVSSVGWGVCGKLNFLLTGGVAQDWDKAPVPLVFNCNLSKYSDPVDTSRAAQAAERTRTFRVAEGTKRMAVLVSADGPDPRVRLVNPAGETVVASVPQGNREVGQVASVIAQPGASQQAFGLADPAAGLWKVQWAEEGGQVTRVQTARDLPAVQAEVSVDRVAGRPGRRVLKVAGVRGTEAGEQLAIGIRTARGLVPLGVGKGRRFNLPFVERETGRRAIVATVLRDGVPLPARSRVIGRYTAKLPPRPRSVRAVLRGRKVVARARGRRSAEPPQAWQYVLRKGRRYLGLKRARPGRPVKFALSTRPRGLSVSVRPVVGDRTPRGKPKTTRVRVPR